MLRTSISSAKGHSQLQAPLTGEKSIWLTRHKDTLDLAVESVARLHLLQ